MTVRMRKTLVRMIWAPLVVAATVAAIAVAPVVVTSKVVHMSNMCVQERWEHKPDGVTDRMCRRMKVVRMTMRIWVPPAALEVIVAAPVAVRPIVVTLVVWALNRLVKRELPLVGVKTL